MADEVKKYAKRATGDMHVFISSQYLKTKIGGKYFWEQELPILLEKARKHSGEIIYHFLKDKAL